ncbi:hypothetical protein [Paenibacillus lignilyticus]|uniref:Secreted protein n=1 Tax=Paenibacillus lignilyticus TaxID=1172615 RepID=A0ABS5C8W2_9BACL|nr:hypothetical protein [Paenibacillus lignilyticus]MBP3962441.1 hypothetical protein [Paenibacillus lignilyticus]
MVAMFFCAWTPVGAGVVVKKFAENAAFGRESYAISGHVARKATLRASKGMNIREKRKCCILNNISPDVAPVTEKCCTDSNI